MLRHIPTRIALPQHVDLDPRNGGADRRVLVYCRQCGPAIFGTPSYLQSPTHPAPLLPSWHDWVVWRLRASVVARRHLLVGESSDHFCHVPLRPFSAYVVAECVLLQILFIGVMSDLYVLWDVRRYLFASLSFFHVLAYQFWSDSYLKPCQRQALG